MGLRECGSEVRFWSEVCGSDWETHSPWVGSRLRNIKETHRGSAFSACRTVGGAMRSACGVHCCEECMWELVLLWGVEIVWSENMNGNDFTGVLGYFMVKGEKHFSWLNLLVQPNTQVLQKSIFESNLKPKQTQPNDRFLKLFSIS